MCDVMLMYRMEKVQLCLAFYWTVLGKYNLYSFEQHVNLKLYVLVNRCLRHRVSPLVSSLFIDRSLGPRISALTLGQSTAALIPP